MCIFNCTNRKEIIMTTFKDMSLSRDLLQSLDLLGFSKPTSIQAEAIPLLLQRENIIAKAITGSGKTGAFGIPIIENIDWVENHPQALIIAPNRELVLQIAQDLSLMGRYKRVKTLAIYGRDSIKSQILALKQKNHIVVATPGRLMDLIERDCVKLDKLKYLILDEGDELLKPEFIRQLSSTFRIVPDNCCFCLFSATINDDVKLAQSCINKEFHVLDLTDDIRPDIHETFYHLEESDKFSFLLRQLNTLDNKGGIIFTSTKEKTEKIFKKLRAKGYSVTHIHSELEQRVRIRNMNGFKDGTYTYLVATDLSARGIDVDGIDLVINYDLPADIANYTHRIGRIGRNGRTGISLSFVSKEQEKVVPKIEARLHRTFDWGDTFFDLITSDISVGNATLSKANLKTNTTLSNKNLLSTSNSNSISTGSRSTKESKIAKDITKLYINGGKRKKLRAADIVGTICSIPTLTPDDIGIIEIKENETYVEIMNNKYQLVLSGLKSKTIKGRLFKVHKAK